MCRQSADLTGRGKNNSLRDTPEGKDNQYTIVVDDDDTFDLSKLPGVDVTKSTEWKNGKVDVDGTTLKVDEGSTEVTYQYVTGHHTGYQMQVTLHVQRGEQELPEPVTITSQGSAGEGIAIAAGAGVLAVGGYYLGTELYRVYQMPGVEALPRHRSELALLVWERAGKPEPASTALYDDVDADNTDLQKAAHWMVEQDLMDEKADNTFKPNTHVTKLRVCVTWDKAKQKGLFDKTEE